MSFLHSIVEAGQQRYQISCLHRKLGTLFGGMLDLVQVLACFRSCVYQLYDTCGDTDGGDRVRHLRLSRGL